jgi:hypothetical protein
MNRRLVLRRLSILRRRLSVALFGMALAGAVLPVLPAPAVSLDDLDGTAICTVGGMLHVDPSGVPRPTDRHASCLLCLPLAHAGSGALAASAPMPAEVSPSLSWVHPPHPSDRPVLARRNLQHHPRAPPLSPMDA